MLIKDRIYKTCGACESRHLISQEIYGCDACKKVLDMNSPEVDYLRAVVHHQRSGSTNEVVCCSWRCMVKALRRIKTDYFVSLPFLHYDKGPKATRAKAFFDLLKATR